jgi:membrane protease YdiL (CAAX protease family)
VVWTFTSRHSRCRLEWGSDYSDRLCIDPGPGPCVGGDGAADGRSATDYLALKLPRRVEVVVGVITIMIFVAASDGISWLLGRDIVSQFQLDTYRSASTTGYLPWLWLTLVVMAPIGEETLFRGFLFRGWHRGPHDVWPVITVIALIWTVSHLQYDLFFMAQIFVSGLLLGSFRWISESTILSMLLHGLLNFEATLETVIAFQH